MLQIDMITSEPKRMAEIADRSEDGADDRREGETAARNENGHLSDIRQMYRAN